MFTAQIGIRTVSADKRKRKRDYSNPTGPVCVRPHAARISGAPRGCSSAAGGTNGAAGTSAAYLQEPIQSTSNAAAALMPSQIRFV